MILENVINKIKEECTNRNLSINRLARLAKINQSTLNSILNGTSANPGIVTISKICDGLNISVNDFFSDELFKLAFVKT